jgi:hypothetical protein
MIAAALFGEEHSLAPSRDLGLGRALRLGLRVADGLGQHLAKLGLSLWRFAREGFCPCGHRQYMGCGRGN